MVTKVLCGFVLERPRADIHARDTLASRINTRPVKPLETVTKGDTDKTDSKLDLKCKYAS